MFSLLSGTDNRIYSILIFFCLGVLVITFAKAFLHLMYMVLRHWLNGATTVAM